ncbi:MAG: hypothetical protein ACQESD_01145 [Thermoplasmatota archaeon]
MTFTVGFILAYVIGVIIFAVLAGRSSFHTLEPSEIAFNSKLGVYQRYYDGPGVIITAPFISKVTRLDYSKMDWREQLRQIAIELDLDQKEIQEIKEKIEESRNKIV